MQDGQQRLFELPEEEQPPYIARQKAMRSIIRGALGAQENGLYLFAAPTGAGKNYCVEDEAAGILVAGLQGQGILGADSKRKWIVFVTPGRENRDRFVWNVRKEVAGRLNCPGAGEIARSHVINLESNIDCFENWVEAQDESALASCPFEAKEEKLNRDIEMAWRKALPWAKNRKQNRYNNKLDKDIKKENEGKALELEGKLRRALSLARKEGFKEGLDVVQKIWPAALLDVDEPQIIAMTSHKQMYPVDTVLKGSMRFYSVEVADRSVFIFDEIDQIKADWLNVLTDRHLEYQPDVMIRDLYHRFCTDEMVADRLLLGSYSNWKRIFNEAKNKSRHRGSKACEGQLSEGWFAKKVGDIERGSNELQRIVRRCHDELNLEYSFDYSEESKRRELDKKELFSLDDIELDSGGDGRYRYSLDKDAGRNLIGTEDKQGLWLGRMMRRSRGVIRKSVSFLIKNVRLMDELFEGEAAFETGQSISEIIDSLGVRNTKTGEVRFWRDLIDAQFYYSGAVQTGKSNDESIYAKGVEYAKLSTKKNVLMTRDLSIIGFESMPEAYLAQIAEHAPCLCMSATWSAPSIKVFSWEYLKDIKNVIQEPDWLLSNAEAIRRETERLNADVRRVYEVETVLMSANSRLSGLGSGASGSLRCMDELEAAVQSSLREICDDENFVKPASKRFIDWFGSCDSQEGMNFELKRFERLLKAVNAWAEGVAQRRHFAGVIFTPKDYARVAPASLDGALCDIAALLIDCKKGRGFFENGIDEDAGKSILYANASNWDVVWTKEANSRLKQGKPTLTFINFKAGGFSKNLQYPMPDCLKKIAKRLSYGYENDSNSCRPEIDIDFAYIESPTHRIRSSCSIDDSDELMHPMWVQELLLGVAEQEELAERGEISLREKRGNIKKLMGKIPSNVKVRDLPSHSVEGARTVAQAIGRTSRSTYKLPVLTIALDENVALSCDFSFFESLPVGYELASVIDVCNGTGLCKQNEEFSVDQMERRVALVRNGAAAEVHHRLLRALFAQDAKEDDRKRFDAERDFALGNMICDRADLETDLNRLTTMINTRFATAGYACAVNATGFAEDIELPISENDTIAQMRRRLEQRLGKKTNLHVREISQKTARFEELMAIPEIKAHWEDRGWPTEPFRPGKVLICPAIFQMVYLGALGEEAGKAIFESYFKGVYTLSRGEASKAERGGDFVVLDARGDETGVWIDFKYYMMSAYLQYKALSSDGKTAKKFEEKARSVDAKCLLVVNVLADEAAAMMKLEHIGTEGTVLSVPYIVRQNHIDFKMMEMIRNAIEAQ